MAEETSDRDEDYKAMVKAAVSGGETFLRLTMSGKVHGERPPWVKAVVRPVALSGQRHYQFVYYDKKKTITKNYTDADLIGMLDDLLAIPFGSIHVQTSSGDLHVRITKKRRALIRKGKPSRSEGQSELAHNRVKRYPISRDAPDDFLQHIGIADASGRIKPTMSHKFRQINEFLRLMHEAISRRAQADKALTLVDCGCGNAYLTFACYHYLNHILGRSALIIGIDRQGERIDQCNRLRAALGWDGPAFFQTDIAGYAPEVAPDVVLSLHACDTATDEAIAQGVKWQSAIILAAPCCQHELRPQVAADVCDPVLKHGLLKQRTADILTDACRAQILEILGYRTDIVEFIDSKHTPKNLMIRATKSPGPSDRTQATRYRALTDFWHIEPSLEKLLKDELAPYWACQSGA